MEFESGRTLTLPTGTVRFCAYFYPKAGKRARKRVRPIAQDVVVFDRLFGVRMGPTGSLDAGHSRYPFAFSTMVESTGPVSTTATDFCEGREPSSATFNGSFGGPSYFDDACPHWSRQVSWKDVGVPGAAAGALEYTRSDLYARPQPFKHYGACVTRTNEEQVWEAIQTLRAMGCEPGRIINRYDINQVGVTDPPGLVYSFEMHNAVVRIAPQGSIVDLVVNGVQPSSITDPSQALRQILADNFRAAKAHETVVTTFAAPVVPGGGVVLVRFFIPGSRAAGGLLKGDSRSWSADPNASSRAILAWDTSSGRASLRVTESCRKGVRGFAFDPHDRCRDALPIKEVALNKVWRDSDSRRNTNLVNLSSEGNALKVRLSILNSYTNSLPGRIGSFSVDEDLVVDPRPGGFWLTADGNGYPAIEAYQFPDGAGAAPQIIALRPIETPHVKAFPKIRADGGGGDAAFDGASWAHCVAAQAARTAICTDKHNGGRQWTMSW